MRGYRAVMMTEHDRGFDESRFQQFRSACIEASSNEILLVPGIEYSDSDNRVHVLTWGLEHFLSENLPTEVLLERVKAENGVAVLAHPNRRSAWATVQPQWLEMLSGIEVWNRKYDGWAPGSKAPALLEGRELIRFVGLDFHTDRQLFPLAMAVELPGEVTEHSVVDAIRRNRCEARGFGHPLHAKAFQSTVAALKIAERARKAAAVTYRSIKGLASQ